MTVSADKGELDYARDPAKVALELERTKVKLVMGTIMLDHKIWPMLDHKS